MEASRAQYGDLPWYLSPLDGAEEDNYCLEPEGENRPERQTVETGGEGEGEEEAAPSCHHGQCSSEYARDEAPEYLQRGCLGPRVIPRPRPPFIGSLSVLFSRAVGCRVGGVVGRPINVAG